MSVRKCTECAEKAVYRIVAKGSGAYRLCRNLCQAHFNELVTNGLYDGCMKVISCKEISTRCRRPRTE